jgi:YlmC/YmxH family sporulation protein
MSRCTLGQLKEKEVINVCDGRRLGCVEDIEFEIDSGKIVSLIVLGGATGFGFGRGELTPMPWSSIKRIGADIVLVDIGEEPPCCEGEPEKPKPPKPPKPPRRCFFG